MEYFLIALKVVGVILFIIGFARFMAQDNIINSISKENEDLRRELKLYKFNENTGADHTVDALAYYFKNQKGKEKEFFGFDPASDSGDEMAFIIGKMKDGIMHVKNVVGMNTCPYSKGFHYVPLSELSEKYKDFNESITDYVDRIMKKPLSDKIVKKGIKQIRDIGKKTIKKPLSKATKKPKK